METGELNNLLRRREFLQGSARGIGGIALGSLLAGGSVNAAAPASPLAAKAAHFAPKAKNVICLHMIGAPSHLDLFDHKKELVERNGQLVPEKLIEGQKFAFIRGRPTLLGSPFRFHRHGNSDVEISELLPHLATVSDELAVINTLETEQINHAPAQLFMQTGFERYGRPSIGAWATYGLGSENENLPAFVVMLTGTTGGAGNSLWGSGFLPTVHQGIEFRRSGDPVLFLSNPDGIGSADRQQIVEGVKQLNQLQLADVGDPEIATRIAQYELAFRMQTSVPDLVDLSQETKATLADYGAMPGGSSFANNCLLARRLVERGVRFVQLYDQGWDHHGAVFPALKKKCPQVDQPIAALIKDLKQRGMLDDTLVIWMAEFGRTPMSQAISNAGGKQPNPGRDHHKDSFAVWMAGGGAKAGTVYGKTDELGYYPVENAVHVNDFHATILHLLGLDHQRLTYKYQGRDFRLTDIAGKVVQGVVA